MRKNLKEICSPFWQHLEDVFVQNGFDHLESFAELDEDDLNALNIGDQQERTKLLTAADFLSDIVGKQRF